MPALPVPGGLAAPPTAALPCAGHYETCSPWQPLPYAEQLVRKRQALADIFARALAADRDGPPTIDAVHAADPQIGYRTKMEYAFSGERGALRLAFHLRGGKGARVALPDGCALAGTNANRAALALVERLNGRGIAPEDLKSLIVRQSHASGRVGLALFVHLDQAPAIALTEFPQASSLGIYFSRRSSPASIVTRVLGEEGEATIREHVNGVDLEYPLLGFFQNHVPAFAHAVRTIAGWMGPAERVIELYAGVGSIGIAIAGQAREVLGVEIEPAAVACATANARRNGITNYRPEARAAQKTPREVLRTADVLILDPPRSGLPPKLLRRITDTLPPRIAYLSCNPETQARDFAAIAPDYRPVYCAGFDFFPQTPHLESLLLLERRDGMLG